MAEISPCATCGDLTQFNIQGKWHDLQATARTGCDACNMLLRGTQLFKIDADRIIDFLIQIDVTLYLYLTNEEKGSEQLNVTLEFYAEEGRLSRWRKIGPGRHVPGDLRSDQTISLMKRWLDECLHTHSACKHDVSSQLPTRLVAVGRSNDELYLHIPKPEERSQYVALSHRWGQHRPIVTNEASLEEHQKHLTLNESSKLFLDAVELTRTLGFPYIWIDSLCIVQDSHEDWSREAGKMTVVFNNATLTLFAHASQDSSASLYPDGNLRNESIALHVFDQANNGRNARNHDETIYVRECYRYPHRLASSYHTCRVPVPSYLATRGWVLQEELLSPRSLNFYAEELSWVCSSYSRCECRIRPNIPLPSMYRISPTQVDDEVSDSKDLQVDPAKHNPNTGTDAQHQFKLSNPSEQEGERVADLLVEWPDVVMEFSHRLLTVPTDKLPAIAGLAGYIQQLSPNEKFAGGLWLSDLSFQLLWSRDLLYEELWVNAMTPEAKTERQRVEMESYTSRHLYSATWAWVSLPAHAAVHYPTRHMAKSPMKRSLDYATQSKKSTDHFSHFVKPLYGDDNFIDVLDINVWVDKITTNSWGPGLLTLACRCIYISISQSATALSFTIVDRSGRREGSWPYDIDLTSFKFNWDFKLLEGDTPSWTIDTRANRGHLSIVNKWRDYRQQYNQKEDIASAADPPLPSKNENGTPLQDLNNTTTTEKKSEKDVSDLLPTNGSKNPIFTLMLAGSMTWVYNFTPKRREGVCILLESIDKVNDVYRRVGYVTGVGSTEAWASDVPKRVIHIA